MKRRNFLRLAAGAAAANAIPWQAVFAAEPSAPAAAARLADIPAIGLKGHQRGRRGSDDEVLRASLRGEVLRRGDAGYDVSRQI